ATADEEVGGELGVQFLLKNHQELLKADFAVNEGGEEPIIIGGKQVNFVQVGEKGTCWTRLVAKGTSCHGSVPALGDNAVVKMSRALERLSSYKPPILILPEIKELISQLVRLLGLEMDITPETVDQAVDLFQDKAFSAYLNALTRMTVSPNSVHGGLKTNIVPDYCEADVDIRVLPGQNKEFVFGELRRLVGDQIEIDIALYHQPTFSPSSSIFYKTIVETVKDSGSDNTVLSCLSSGATDSRYLRQHGIPSYGLGLMVAGFDQDLRKTVHGVNERIDIASLKLKADFLVQLARRYLKD
ncbi:MAG: M20/M25/M40 family metallo-hydrolase, partial [Dehalococcoidia bacterium]|nr:M20/M25/M40 family metallo-hydrolase [Dehalococcoidia bacterium]